MTKKFITRFAPSPTGFLHIGGARTALFNRLLANANNGEMKLRIEDTDRERSTDEAVDAIIKGLKWLEVEWDGEPISQFSRQSRHKEIAQELLENGHAYKHENAIRMKVPDGVTIVDDQVQGQVKFDNKKLEDFVLLRSDGSPTYMLAVVVDDHDMKISHILRGDDHLVNAAKQTLIYKAMGWEVPVMAHIPLIHGPDGKKLSKRHGALGIKEYEKQGYLPEALRNYLLRLGWSHGDQEYFCKDELKEIFGFEGMRKSPARLDFKKLENMNGYFLKKIADDRLIDLLKDMKNVFPNEYIEKWRTNEEIRENFSTLITELKVKHKDLIVIAENSKFMFEDRPDKVKIREVMDGEKLSISKDLLTEYATEIHKIPLESWTENSIRQTTDKFIQENELELGSTARLLRSSLIADSSSMRLFYVMFALGKDEAIRRLNAAEKIINAPR